jgi:hypothetical protein
VRITSGSALSKDEIERCGARLQENAEADKAARELIEARNKAEALVYEAEKNLKEHGAKLDDAEKKAVEDAVAELKGVKDGDDQKKIRSTRSSRSIRRSTRSPTSSMRRPPRAIGPGRRGSEVRRRRRRRRLRSEEVRLSVALSRTALTSRGGRGQLPAARRRFPSGARKAT